ncbi:MAG: methyltransferase domain-containing protein [Burkholderiales bacterium]|nr:methyltransferase domain-containing protein [Burkholderiales bacterium]
MSAGLGDLWRAVGPVRAQPVRRHAVRGAPEVGQPGKDAVWVPTPAVLLEEMLDMARVGPGDRLLDLGAGDGRILIAAARRGAHAVGIEYDPQLVRLARRNVREAGVADRVRVRCGDLFETDLGQADVITFYLLPHLNLRLRPALLGLAPGTRLVSQSFGMGDWRPDAQVVRDGRSAFFWAVPADVQGEWWVEYADGAPWQRWHLRQRYQYVEGEVHSSEGCARLRAGRLRGAAMEFVLGRLGAGRRHYRGQVAGDSMRGICMMPDGSCRAWSAARVAR